MCKHIVNAQVSIRAPCCRKWYDCPECHEEKEEHELRKTFEMVFACKKCKKVFRKDTREFDEQDEFCPHCDNQFIIEAKESKPVIEFEATDVRMDSRIVKDQRIRQTEKEAEELDWTL